MAFNLGQILSSAGSTGVPAYDQGYTTSLIRAGQQALGNALFMPGAQQMPGPQAPPPGQQSMPQQPGPPPPGPPQVVGNMFGGMPGWAAGERPLEMGAPPMGQMTQQPSPPAPPPGVGGGAPPPAGGAPLAGVGMHDPILARIAAANPGAPPQVLMSAYQQYVMMGRSRYGLSPESLTLRQMRERRLMEQEQRLGMRAEDRQATRAAMQPAGAPTPQRAINPQTGHIIIQQGGQWVDEQSGQPLAAPAKKPGKQSAADNTEFSSQARRPQEGSAGNYNPMQQTQAAPEEPRRYRGAEVPMSEFDRREREQRALPPGPQADAFGPNVKALQQQPGVAELLKGMAESDQRIMLGILSKAGKHDLGALTDLTPRQRTNLRGFLMDNEEFPASDQEMQDIYGREGAPMSTERWGRVPGSPSKRRPYPSGQ